MNKIYYAKEIVGHAHFYGINEKLSLSKVMKRRKSQLVSFMFELDGLFCRPYLIPSDLELRELFTGYGFCF